MAEGRRTHGRWFDAVATVLIGLVVTGAALVPAVTANSGETITIRGDVSVDGRRLAFFPVGFWVPDTGDAVAPTRTDANGVFTLDVPITLDGYAYAGSEPDSATAITDSDGLQVVRGTIGAKLATPIASPLYQGWETATGRALAGGAAQLHFRLQEAGRIGGTLPLPASRVRAVQVRRLDGSVVQRAQVDARGRWLSRLLVPGRYAVAVLPVPPLLPVAVQVDVAAGRTVRATLPAPVTGATVTGTVQSDPGTDLDDLPVLLQQDDRVLARTTTDGRGQYRFAGVAAGEYVVEVGRFESAQDAAVAAAAVPVPITGSSASPSPTPTATAATPTPAPGVQVLQPAEQVADAVRPATSAVTVPEGLGEVSVATDAVAAGRIGGAVTGADGSAVQVVVEDSQTQQVLRTVDTDAAGRYSVGGLQQGEQYTVWAVTRPTDPTQARMGSTDGFATASTTGVDVSVDRSAAGLRGTVDGAAGGSVTVGDASLLTRSADIDSSGAYAVQGLVPGLYPAVVRVAGRLDSDPVAVQVTEAGDPQDLQRGPEGAGYRAWFISAGDGVPLVSGTATSATGSTARFGPQADDGHLSLTGLRPGSYAYDADSFAGTVPAIDGPWWFDAPEGGFVLADGAPNDVGPVVLHVRAR